MRIVSRCTDRTRVLIQVGLLVSCCLIAVAVRAVIAADTLSDPVELALNAVGMTVLFASAAVSFVAVRATHSAVCRASGALMSLSLVCLAAAFVRLSYPDVSIELADLIAPAEAAETPSHIVVGPLGQDVRLSGDIQEGAAALLDRILKANPSIHRVHLTSEGGLADEGQALAEVIAAHHLTTYVPDYCVSACTLAFVAGQERLLMDGARLGFHAPYEQGLLGQTFAGDSKVQRAAYIKAGVPTDFVDEALKTSPDDIWIPAKDRLLKANVVTGYVDRYQLPDSTLDGAADGQGARDVVLRNFPTLKSVDAVSPQAIDRIADWYLASYRHGLSEGEGTDRLRMIVNATLTLVLARADEATLLDLDRFMGTALRKSPSTEDCAAIGEHVDVTRAVAVLEASDKDAEDVLESFVTRALVTGRKPLPTSTPTPIAYGPHEETCAALRQAYADATQRHDATQLRQRLQSEAPKAARLLAPLAAEAR